MTKLLTNNKSNTLTVCFTISRDIMYSQAGNYYCNNLELVVYVPEIDYDNSEP